MATWRRRSGDQWSPGSADALDRDIERLLRGEAAADGDPLLRAAALVHRLGSEPLPDDIRARHLAALRSRPVPSGRVPRLRQRLALAAASLSAVASLAGGGAVAAAQDALPGDALYGVKRWSEQAALLAHPDPDGDAALRLRFAQRRAEEARHRPALAGDLLAEAASQASAAGARNGAGAVATLTRLLSGDLPEKAAPRARDALASACRRIAEHAGVHADGCATDDPAEVEPARVRGGDDRPARRGPGAVAGRDDPPAQRGGPDERAGRAGRGGASDGGAPGGPADPAVRESRPTGGEQDGAGPGDGGEGPGEPGAGVDDGGPGPGGGEPPGPGGAGGDPQPADPSGSSSR